MFLQMLLTALVKKKLIIKNKIKVERLSFQNEIKEKNNFIQFSNKAFDKIKNNFLRNKCS